MLTMPAQWEKQDLILLSFPHEETDWAEDLQASLSPFIRIAQAIAYAQAVYILCKDKEKTAALFCSTNNMTFIEIPTNDTWIRDYGYISVRENEKIKLLDFTFDGWGRKFAASLDNQVNSLLHKKGYMSTRVLETMDFVLEGGSVESDGEGTILSTSGCLCNPNRNSGLSKEEIEKKLRQYLGAKRILWLDEGYLAGDDTDAHIDTLARFIDASSIAYVACEDEEDEHYISLKKMKKQLEGFKTKENKPYRLIALALPEAKYSAKGKRLPATYANFLICNHALLYPSYKDKNDTEVHKIFKKLFPDKEIIPIDCLKLIEQGGSLHCSSMQIPH
ncbi:MAG: agmatine deiminase [Gammaproteobacteria bacterium]|nr:MAG: agmatine deiminase [Gammaproteobacteria bacterium]